MVARPRGIECKPGTLLFDKLADWFLPQEDSSMWQAPGCFENVHHCAMREQSFFPARSFFTAHRDMRVLSNSLKLLMRAR